MYPSALGFVDLQSYIRLHSPKSRFCQLQHNQESPNIGRPTSQPSLGRRPCTAAKEGSTASHSNELGPPGSTGVKGRRGGEGCRRYTLSTMVCILCGMFLLHMHMQMRTHIHIHIHRCIPTYLHKYLHTCLHAYTPVCIHAYKLTHMPAAYMHTSIEALRRTCIHAYIARMQTHKHQYTRAYTHTHIHTYIHTYIRACMHACMHAYIHTYTRTCMHAYIHPYIHHIHYT